MAEVATKTVITNFTYYVLSEEAIESVLTQMNSGKIPVLAGSERTLDLDSNIQNDLDKIVGFVKAGSAKLLDSGQIQYEISFRETPMFNIVRILMEEKLSPTYSLAMTGELNRANGAVDLPVLEGKPALIRVNCYCAK